MTKAALANATWPMEQRERRWRAPSAGRSAAQGSDSNPESVSANSSARTAAVARRAAVAAEHPPDACRYPNKRCFRPRARKNNGQLHKFCEAHRDSANQYQRRLEQRLKQKRIESRLRILQAQREQAAAMAAAAVGRGASTVAIAAAAPRVAAPIASGTQNVLAVHYAVNHPGILHSRSVGSNPINASAMAFVRPESIVAPNETSLPVADALPVPLGVSSPVLAPSAPELEPFRFPVSLADEDIKCLYDLFLEP